MPDSKPCARHYLNLVQCGHANTMFDPSIFQRAITVARKKNDKYAQNAYLLILEALDSLLSKQRRTAMEHITCKALAEAIQKLLVAKYGPYSILVLKDWGIASRNDFGQLLQHMSDMSILCLSEEDNIDDFVSSFNYEEYFIAPYNAAPPYPDFQVLGK